MNLPVLANRSRRLSRTIAPTPAAWSSRSGTAEAVSLRGDPDHPFTRGFLCQKVARYLERVYHPDRLK